jgi:integrase
MRQDLAVNSIDDLLKMDTKTLIMSLQKWINKRAQETSIKTIKFEVYLARSFFSFHDIELPPRKVKLPRKAYKSRIDRIPSIAEIQKLIMGSRSPRMRLAIMMMALTGMRLSECLNVRREHVDLDRGVIVIPAENTKMGRYREVPIPSELRQELQRYFSEYFKYERGYVFSVEGNPEKRIITARFYEDYVRLLKRLGLDQRTPDGSAYLLHPHVFRKWYRTMLESAGVNKLLIDLWMGHNSGVEKLYYLPTPEMIKQELEKADRVLRIFGQVAPPGRIEEYREHIDMLWHALLKVAETVSEENPKLLEKLERLGISYARAPGPESSFTGMIVKPDLLKRSR